MNLPLEFMEKMKRLLKDEYESFISSFDGEHYRGIRINTLKISVREFLEICPFDIEKVSWSKEGFYIKDGDDTRPGKHPYYHCGLYYIQEPSAMIPVEVLDPQPGEKVLDISAAPGGKATQIGAKLKEKGILVANDISPKRVKALVKNIEVFGIKNSIVTNETPENLSKVFESYFDKILVDAPCSGEGMFRRDPKATKSWNSFSSQQCCAMQKQILDYVPKMLRPGGKLVYSTCTFAPEENEGTIQWLINKYPELEIEEIKNIDEIDRGRPEWIDGNKDLIKTKRAWPHRVKGEGHFIALLKKKDGEQKSLSDFFKIKSGDIDSFLEFSRNYLKNSLDGNLHLVGNRLFLIPNDFPDLSEIKTVNTGLYLGEIKKNRFEPSQALAIALKQEDVTNSISFPSESIEAVKYLKGETLIVNGEKGWRLVCIDGFPAGWGKQTKDHLKNSYRPEWRMK
jgi:NOL1/NOP2/sun family putative RNA methylase